MTDIALDEKLAPCPFCGSAGDYLETGVWWIRCNDCGADAESGKTREIAASNWNRRTPSQVAPANPAQVTEPAVNELFANCDRWGAVEWFDRLAMAIHNRDKAVVEGNDLSFATYDNIAKSSAARLVHDFEAEMRATLTAAIGAGVQAGWRSMDSAPKDGTLILLAKAGDPDWPMRCRRWQDTHWRGRDAEDATHWQPLPASPYVSDGGSRNG